MTLMLQQREPQVNFCCCCPEPEVVLSISVQLPCGEQAHARLDLFCS